ncbi:ATP-binding protein [uncultured Vibrio sp.]|uniref:hybrid sensor histidine kinase/response regulator n=1 Tax=uncultured Vibrio sp. TaxID=114054 RepID=UPI00091872BE|nr:ATP-binding protein [uncultured Vibrio sp.]OIQ26434.1 MAG: hypothetical protein BM561_01345 [Vibrio sp. MedPE-SWchi]
MNKTTALFLFTILALLCFGFFSLQLYKEHARLVHYRSGVSELGHEVIELRDKVTQHIIYKERDPYFLTQEIVNIETSIEALALSFEQDPTITFGIRTEHAHHAIEEFTKNTLTLTDALDHAVGVIIVDRTTFEAIYHRADEILNDIGEPDLSQRLLSKRIESGTTRAYGDAEFERLLATYKNINQKKADLFSQLLSAESSHFVEHSEVEFERLAADVRNALTQVLGVVAIIIVLFVSCLYYLRIKELQRNNHAFQRAVEEAEQASDSKSLFLATMSHELRTPMNGVLGLAEVIQAESHEEETKEHARVILDSGQHLVTLLDDILDFSKVEGGKMTLEETEFNIEDLITHVTQALEPLAQARHNSLLVTNNIPRTVRIISDSSRIRQIIFNLLGNAIKFTDQGEVSIKIALLEPTSQLSIIISDTGIGIPRDKLDAIFTPFEQADLTTTRKFGGTGLGLSIVKQITDLMGGDIAVFSQPNVGTKFTLTLPVSFKVISELPSKPLEDDQVNSAANQTLTILLVEDNQVNAIVAKHFLSSCGHRTKWVSDGLKAIHQLKRNHFDLVIIDNHMPNISGVETIQRVRKELQLETIIFGYTADVFKEAHDAFIQAGANFVLTKPLQKANLEKAIRQFHHQIHSQPHHGALEDTVSNVIPLSQPSIDELPMTEEELTRSALMQAHDLSPEEKVDLLNSLESEFLSKSQLLIHAFFEQDFNSLHAALHSIKGIALEFGMNAAELLAAECEALVMVGDLPKAEQLQKLINLMLVNCHQATRMLEKLHSQKETG